MSDANLRVRSVSEIVDAAFALYRRHGMQYITLAALASAPALILNLILSGGAPPTTAAGLTKLLPGTIIGMISFALVSAAIIRMGSDAYLGSEPNVAATIREVLPRVPALILATVITTIMVFVAALFLVLPMFYVVTLIFATIPLIILEQKGAFAAISRSMTLSAGIKWHILGTLGLVFGIYFVLSLAIPLLSALLGGGPVVQMLMQTLFGVVAAPILYLVVMVLYYDARIRAEGFDVEHMAQSLGADPAMTH